jgi:hypothetical protein
MDLLLFEQHYFYKMCLLRITIECKSKKLNETKNMLDMYLKINSNFGNNKNCKLLQNIILSVENDNFDQFKEFIFKYDCQIKIPKDEYKLITIINNSFSKL